MNNDTVVIDARCDLLRARKSVLEIRDVEPGLRLAALKAIDDALSALSLLIVSL